MPEYDVFISYRHGDPDRGDAVRIDLILQKFDIVAAFDERDFSPQETFFDEMARCIQESKYTIALLSKRYLDSFNTREEAVMQKCLDNAERKRRLIPVYLEPCDPPLWLQPLVGIRLYEKNVEPNPIEKLVQIISETANSSAGLGKEQIQEKVKRIWSKVPADLISGVGIGMAGYGALDHFFSKDEVDIATLNFSESKQDFVSTDNSEALKIQTDSSKVDDADDALSGIKSFLSDIF